MPSPGGGKRMKTNAAKEKKDAFQRAADVLIELENPA